MNTERFAVPEVLFTPSDAGIAQLGLADCTHHVLDELIQADGAVAHTSTTPVYMFDMLARVCAQSSWRISTTTSCSLVATVSFPASRTASVPLFSYILGEHRQKAVVRRWPRSALVPIGALLLLHVLYHLRLAALVLYPGP